MKLFPSGIAEGKAFCNRNKERARLVNNISETIHTVLVAPRRYGKTSLIKQVMLEQNYHYVWVDFLSVTNKAEVEEKILKAGKALLMQLAPELKKLQLQTTDLIKALSPELNLGAMGQSLTLHLTSDKSISIDEMLLQIDEYAQKVGKRAVIVFDEFQQISELEQNNAIEALIRHAIERSKAITYLFSGSNRQLLAEMFSKSSRPLYRLCQVMTIERITKEDYVPFLNSAAKNRWKESLAEDTINTIVELTECHPFYMNVLCSELWVLDNLPNKEQVQNIWEWYVDTHKGIVTSDIVALPLNQKKVITNLADEPTSELYGNEFCSRTKLSLSSVRRTISALISKDIIYIDREGKYQLLDPALKYYLR